MADWRLKHPDWRTRYRRRHSRSANNRARERRLSWYAAGDVTLEQLHEIYIRDGGRCVYCKAIVVGPRFAPGDPHGFDHLIPRNNGGAHTASNIVTSCGSCNQKKGTQPVNHQVRLMDRFSLPSH